MFVTIGITPQTRTDVARLYWQAFGSKLGRVLGPTAKAEAFIELSIGMDHGICAVDADGRVLGVVGFQTHKGSLVNGKLADMRHIYGRWGGSWRNFVLGCLTRDVENTRFIIDGLVVDAAARGRGVGSALIEALSREAQNRGYHEIKLEVADTNLRARALYERCGFKAVQQRQLWLSRLVYGVRSTTTMVRKLN